MTFPIINVIMRTSIFICCLLAGVQLLHAQKGSAPPVIKFRSINNIGVLQGESGAAFQWQSVNGVQYNTWFAGIGAGMDYYKYRGVPLFFDVRKEFGTTTGKIFVYGDLGIHFNALTTKQKEENQYSFVYEFHKGLYTDIGLGYIVPMHASGFVVSVGYTYKTLNQSKEDYTPAEYPGPPARSNIRYTMGRISFKVGLRF